MSTVRNQIISVSNNIDKNICYSVDDRGHYSQNIIKSLRDLVEGLMVWIHTNDSEVLYDTREYLSAAKEFISSNSSLNVLTRFHELLQVAASHYFLDPGAAERLMLKYYEYLIKTRSIAKDYLNIDILQNLEDFPIDQDKSLDDYYREVVEVVNDCRTCPSTMSDDRYYIYSIKPIFIDGKIYYEVSFSYAHDRINKFDRMVAYTAQEMLGNYSVKMGIIKSRVKLMGKEVPINVINDWKVSIRPCELKNFNKIMGFNGSVKSEYSEYVRLMQYLTDTKTTLLDYVNASDKTYSIVKGSLAQTAQSKNILLALDKAREIIKSDGAGARILRYLLLKMNNNIIKAQYSSDINPYLSNLYLAHGCRPFDTMPYCTSPLKHNPKFMDLTECIELAGREHELLARRIRNNVEDRGEIYTPDKDLTIFGDITELIKRHNALLPPKQSHKLRELKHVSGHVFIDGYEKTTVDIINRLKDLSNDGLENYDSYVQNWLFLNEILQDNDPRKVDDDLKINVIKRLFTESKDALIYGAAGTGKTTLVNHISDLFDDRDKLFLAHTNPAVENLQNRVNSVNSSFSTISKHLRSDNTTNRHYHLLIIDECSTVSNNDLKRILDCTSFDLLLLVGDVFQIESIRFGNWFSLVESYLPSTAVNEITRPFRATDKELIQLWNRVRELDDRIEESLSKLGCSKELNSEIFYRNLDEDEITLCLNYDGLYGINNINSFLQSVNPNPEYRWGDYVFKVGDPILFNDVDRFKPVLFNNMKGRIVGIESGLEILTFDVDIFKSISADEASDAGLRLIGDGIVQFDLYHRIETDEEDESLTSILPFQIAYAVSIHKSQGLEYDSVNIVITNASEENVSHSVFYTAITRARKELRIFWTPEVQKRVIDNFSITNNHKNQSLLRVRHGLQPINKRQKIRRNRIRP